jgi:aspartate racemase
MVRTARIGLIGGLSWEATACYYRYFNQFHTGPSPWSQPPVVIDSLDMADVVAHQRADDWEATGRLLSDAARRLVAGGASVLGIGANTMHRNYDDVRDAVSCRVVDIRACVAEEVVARGGNGVGLLGTKYVIEQDFYSHGIEEHGVGVVTPDATATTELQRIIFDELTQGILREESRDTLLEIGASLIARGADAVGLCCTEFGLLIDEDAAPFAVVDSTKAHVRALLGVLDEQRA